MRRLLVVLALTACGGNGGSTIPRGKPSVQLVRCIPATPPPLSTDTAPKTADVERRRGFSIGGRVVAGKKAAVSFGTIVTDGAIGAGDVAALARVKQPNMLACFGAAGMSRFAVTYKFTIGSDGAVGQVDTTSRSLGGALDSCLRGAFRSLRFPARGATTAVTFPVVYDSTGAFAVPEKQEPTIEPDPWTPFAIDNRAVTTAAAGAARATEAAMRGRVAAIDKCFANPASTGSLRILLELDIAGELSSVRAGGIGDKDGELCAARSLAGLKVLTPSQEHVEIACDLSRGDAAPWRVSPAAGYEVIDIDARGLKHGTDVVVPGVSEPEPLPAETYVVVARPDTLGGMLQLALMWARDATVLLSVGDGKAPPVFLGMGNASPAEEDGEALRPAIRVGKEFATGCIGRATHKANVTSSTELGGLMQKLAARCRMLSCAPTLVVAMDSDARASDLLELAGAARRNGFDRVLFGGSELGCTPELKKKNEDVEYESDYE